MTPKFTLSPEVEQAMKNFQALYNEDANKMVKEAAWEKEILKFLIDLATIAMVAEDTKPTKN